MKKKYVSFKKIKEYIKILDSNINKSNWNPDIILSINRGGCVPWVFLSHLRDINHEVLSFKNKIVYLVFWRLDKINLMGEFFLSDIFYINKSS